MSTAFVLSGEGARGGIQAAILQHLTDIHVRPDAVYGVSSGAINAAGFAYAGPELLCNVWRDIRSIGHVFRFNWLSWPWATGLYNTKPIERTIREIIQPDYVASMPVHISRFSTKYQEIEWISSHNNSRDYFIKAIIDSIRIPGLVEASYDGYVDAGSKVLAPVGRAIQDGHDDIYVILGSSKVTEPLPGPSFGASAIYGASFVFEMLETIMDQDILRCFETWKSDRIKPPKMHIWGPREDKPLWNALNFEMAFCGSNVDIMERKWQRT